LAACALLPELYVKCRLPGLHPKSPHREMQAVGSMVGAVL